MKLLSQFKTCDIITIKDGFLFALKGAIGFLIKDPRFKNIHAGVDAKIFVNAIKKFNDDFFVRDTEEELILFDASQEVTFKKLGEDKIPKIPKETKFIQDNKIVQRWNFINSFIDIEYPAVKVTCSFFEVLSGQHILRLLLPYNQPGTGVFANCKLPQHINAYFIEKDKLWFKGLDFWIISAKLELALPSTDNFFNLDLEWQPIPDKLRVCLMEGTELLSFEARGVVFTKDGRATSVVEGIVGRGTYLTDKFKKFVDKSAYYYFDADKVFFKGEQFQGVLASAV